MSIYSLSEKIKKNLPSKHLMESRRLRETNLIAKVSSENTDWYIICGNKQRTNAVLNDWIFYGIMEKGNFPIHCCFKLPVKVLTPNIDQEKNLTWDRNFSQKDWVSYLDKTGLAFQPAIGPAKQPNIKGNQYFEPEHFDLLSVNDRYQISSGHDESFDLTCSAIQGNVAKFVYTHDCRDFEIRLPVDELSDRLYRANGHDASIEYKDSIRVYEKNDQLVQGNTYCVDDVNGRSRVAIYIGKDQQSQELTFSTCDYFPDDVVTKTGHKKPVAYQLENQYDWDVNHSQSLEPLASDYEIEADDMAMN